MHTNVNRYLLDTSVPSACALSITGASTALMGWPNERPQAQFGEYRKLLVAMSGFLSHILREPMFSFIPDTFDALAGFTHKDRDRMSFIFVPCPPCLLC